MATSGADPKGNDIPVDDPEYLTATQLAKKLNVGLRWVEKQTQARRIPGQIKIGRYWRYRRVDVEKRLLQSDQFLVERVPIRKTRFEPNYDLRFTTRFEKKPFS